MGRLTLVLGGARSGKSREAERRASSGAAPVTYLATAVAGGDTDFAGRIALHRARRPAEWTTVEAGGALVEHLRTIAGTALVDSLGTWVASHDGFECDSAAIVEVLRSREGDTIVVSEEVGLGVHPSTALGRQFRDALGSLNQEIAEVADEVIFVVAGRAMPLERFA